MPTARIVHLEETQNCKFTKGHTGVSASSWIEWWAIQNEQRPRFCCIYQMNDATGRYERCEERATDGAHVKHAGSAWILPTCHSCNMMGKTTTKAAHTHTEWLQPLDCNCPFQNGHQMQSESPAFQSPHW
jgi:hypothetical protein